VSGRRIEPLPSTHGEYKDEDKEDKERRTRRIRTGIVVGQGGG
jgi:hypothetical protein